MTQVARIDRMFGDSANEDNDHDKKPNLHLGNNKFGSVSSNSTNSSSLHGETFYSNISNLTFCVGIDVPILDHDIIWSTFNRKF